jgi:hypothetical protein
MLDVSSEQLNLTIATEATEQYHCSVQQPENMQCSAVLCIVSHTQRSAVFT